RSACGTPTPRAVAEGNIFLSRECASRPEGFLLYGNSRGISYKAKKAAHLSMRRFSITCSALQILLID
ncbi:MAG: hypothetical protein K6B44_02955, partial [Lachnospiraceae bacterium]|nr:hypothetical protein [Lachnospiraceae bacterium]